LLRTWGCQESQPLPDEWRKFSSDVFSSGSSKDSEVEYEDNVFSLTFAPIANAEYLNIYGLDITERKRVEEELQTSHEQLRNLSSYLQSAREQERTSIAREIHDDLGQTITALKMDLSWFGKRLPKDHEPLREKKKSMDKTLNEALESIERIITELRPGVLDDLGLIAAIEWQGGDFQDRTGIRCKFNIDPEEIVLDKERSTAIFRIFQETLVNITRHANATRVNISLTEEEDKLVLKVKDDGKGIREEQISDSKSFGLMGIRERAHLFGGKVKIKGVKGKGTTVTVSIPVEKE
jgi:signal transduction histidine kinase